MMLRKAMIRRCSLRREKVETPDRFAENFELPFDGRPEHQIRIVGITVAPIQER